MKEKNKNKDKPAKASRERSIWGCLRNYEKQKSNLIKIKETKMSRQIEMWKTEIRKQKILGN